MLPLFCIAGVKRLCVESSSMVYWWKFTCQLIEAIVKLGKCQHGQTVVRSTILVRCWFSAWYLIFASRSKTIENRCCWCCEQIPCACVGEKKRERERENERGMKGYRAHTGSVLPSPDTVGTDRRVKDTNGSLYLSLCSVPKPSCLKREHFKAS